MKRQIDAHVGGALQNYASPDVGNVGNATPDFAYTPNFPGAEKDAGLKLPVDQEQGTKSSQR